VNDARTFTIVNQPRAEPDLRAAFDEAGLRDCNVLTRGQQFSAVIARV
jgi:hypothetical protein